MSKTINLNCKECGKKFEKSLKEYNRQIRNGRKKDRFFCSLKCSSKYINRERNKEKETIAKKEEIEWTQDLSYLVGLIASDGCLVKGRPRIQFTSKDYTLIEQVKSILKDITNKTTKIQQKGTNKYIRYDYRITSRKLYYFLKNIGIKPNKSLTIKKVDVPKKYFSDFLRGYFDGDGSISKKRYGYVIGFYSGSLCFLKWLFNKINDFVDINGGSLYYNSGCYNLCFYIKDTEKIIKYIYSDYKDSKYLKRKEKIATNIL